MAESKRPTRRTRRTPQSPNAPRVSAAKTTTPKAAPPKPKTSSAPVAGKSYKERGDRAAAATPAKPKIAMPKVDTNRVQAKFGQGSSKTVMHKGKKMANVTREQLDKSGMSLREYMNKWNKTGKRPS